MSGPVALLSGDREVRVRSAAAGRHPFARPRGDPNHLIIAHFGDLFKKEAAGGPGAAPPYRSIMLWITVMNPEMKHPASEIDKAERPVTPTQSTYPHEGRPLSEDGARPD